MIFIFFSSSVFYIFSIYEKDRSCISLRSLSLVRDWSPNLARDAPPAGQVWAVFCIHGQLRTRTPPSVPEPAILFAPRVGAWTELQVAYWGSHTKDSKLPEASPTA